MTLQTALFFRYDINGDDYLAALANSFVHVLMYSHYLMSAFKVGPAHARRGALMRIDAWMLMRRRSQINAWWKKQLTTLQLVQFTLVLGQTVYAYVVGGPACGCPDWLKARLAHGASPALLALLFDLLAFSQVLMVLYQCSMLVLFGLFYVSSYRGAREASKKGRNAVKKAE